MFIALSVSVALFTLERKFDSHPMHGKLTICQCDVHVTCRFKTFGCFETATAVLIPLQGLEMAWPFRNSQLFLLAILIPHQFDITGQVCFVAFKCSSCNTIKSYIFIRTAFGLL